ncbi:hypothetical protein E2986_01750 [Frieseomelitta varia]|uniref:Dephospho-CoA kinase n=1 Tax=Frieseomelitta varia TaxID=561572 RepID=A0A833RRM0_9HYME|nr:hypothetical protein E2986_01750 [Frieseomelitta varia]
MLNRTKFCNANSNNIHLAVRTSLTGGIATGKSSVAAIFLEFGIPVIDADQIARKVVEPGKPAWHKIRQEFGPEMFLDTNELDRTKLGDVVFNDVEKRKKLNAITHPEICREIYWQTLNEEDLQLQRLIERSGFTEAKAKIRIAAQMSLERKAEMANFVIENSGSQRDTREQTIRIINVLKASKYHWKLRFLVGFCCTVLLAGAYWLRSRSLRPLPTIT